MVRRINYFSPLKMQQAQLKRRLSVNSKAWKCGLDLLSADRNNFTRKLYRIGEKINASEITTFYEDGDKKLFVTAITKFESLPEFVEQVVKFFSRFYPDRFPVSTSDALGLIENSGLTNDISLLLEYGDHRQAFADVAHELFGATNNRLTAEASGTLVEEYRVLYKLANIDGPTQLLNGRIFDLVLRLTAEATSTLAEEYRVLYKLANIDGLTGLHNRRAFDLVLQESADKKLGLILLDIDRSETFIHENESSPGDEFLKKIAAVIKEVSEKNQCTPSRFVGGEFAILVPGKSREDIEKIAKTLQGQILDLKVGQSITANVGVSFIDRSEESEEPGLTVKELLNRADLALYSLKIGIGNQVVPYWTMEPALVNLMAETRSRDAKQRFKRVLWEARNKSQN